MAEKWNMNFTINGRPATILRFKVGDSEGKGYIALNYEPQIRKDATSPTFFPTKEAAEAFLISKRDKNDEKLASMWWN